MNNNNKKGRKNIFLKISFDSPENITIPKRNLFLFIFFFAFI